ncbi:MAG: cytochrome c biogenesis protein CcmG, thiol:disulfide interchange protein DsbE [Chloroflexi bacterium]|jgi:cytochrome c biogenesis protein CcmG/thiol:disulfide interchange protein DsbE|nr:MAG: cytochrome c biogenesis protein CcmG, thiol:disulfide interchange protein DsbE [Chloroflexota bacterium]
MRSIIQGNTNVVKGIAILIVAILITLFTVFLATGLSNRTSATGRSGEQLIDKKSPDFLAVGIDGDPVSLSNYLGLPIVLNFWASWCPPCRDETPHFEKIWRLYRQKDVVVLGINVQDTLADADEYIREFDVTFTNAIDKNGKIMVDYGVTGLPVTFFIDRDGIIIGRWVGSIGESSLQLRAEALENDSFRDIYGSDKNQDGFRKFN